MASGLRGVNHLRRTLRRIDPEMIAEARTALKEGAEAIKLDAIARVPRHEGDLARSIDFKLGRDGLTAIIGPAAKQVAMVGGRTSATAPFATGSARQARLSTSNKTALFEFFKGYWLEYGTKGSPEHNIPPLRPRPFMNPAFDVNKEWILEQVKKGINKALERAARNGGE